MAYLTIEGKKKNNFIRRKMKTWTENYVSTYLLPKIL